MDIRRVGRGEKEPYGGLEREISIRKQISRKLRFLEVPITGYF